MGTVLYFILIAGFFFLMMRFGCGAHVMGHGHGAHEGHGAGSPQSRETARWLPPETDIDPVSRMSVRTDSAKSAVYRGAVYYFSSDEHREMFEAEPERYIGAKTGAEGTSAEHHHG